MSSLSFLPVALTGAEASFPCSEDSPEKCEEHGEGLSVFCLDDLEPLCKQCAAGSHEGHRVYLLTEAATDCKEELRTSQNGLKKKMIHFEKVTQACEHASRHNQAEAELIEEHRRKEFESLHQYLKEEEEARLLVLREEEEVKQTEAREQIKRMNKVITSLEDKIQLMEEQLDAGGDGVEFLERYQHTMSSDREPQAACRPLIDVAKHLGNLQYSVWKKMMTMYSQSLHFLFPHSSAPSSRFPHPPFSSIHPPAPVSLDPRTAGQSLTVSRGLNSVHISPGRSQSLDVSVPERFHPYSCILAREGFDSGVHCWNIEVGDTGDWTVGVAAQSVSRRTEFETCPEAGLWCISLREGQYQALTTPSQDLNMDSSLRLSSIRVKLDWDEGTLEFLNADAETHLFTFRHGFTEKLYPYFESKSLCGSLTVLPQRVNVSVGSDYVSVGDAANAEEDQMIKRESCIEGELTSVSTNSNKISEHRHLTGGKNSDCSESKLQRCTVNNELIKPKPKGKGKSQDITPAVRKQTRFSVAYHVSLNRALNTIHN